MSKIGVFFVKIHFSCINVSIIFQLCWVIYVIVINKCIVYIKKSPLTTIGCGRELL